MNCMPSRRRFLSQTSLSVAGFMLIPNLGFANRSSNKLDFVQVETRYGKLKGFRDNGVNIFKGVPDAGSVSGVRRFRRPAPLQPWAGVRDAMQLGPPSMQNPVQTHGINEPDPQEDCLVLNIWTPATDHGNRPVMFYNHGGGFSHGSGGSASQDGANLARNFNVVVVETNHRLGLMGYLYLDQIAGGEYTGSGNMGLLDIVEGLKWVHENIVQFGGDPDNVMIFGESGGGAKTSCLYAMPVAAPYFNKASIESGPGIRMTEPEIADQTTHLLLKELNIPVNSWQKLLEVPIADLMEMQVKLLKIDPQNPSVKSIGIGPARPGSFSPVVDGISLPQHPFDPVAPSLSVNKPLMIGWNEDEYTFFGMVSKDLESFNLDESELKTRLEQRYGKDAESILKTYKMTRPTATPSNIHCEIATMAFSGLGSIYIAEKKAAQNGAPAYLYNFGYKSELKIPGTDYEFGTPHAMDIPFKFNNLVESKGGNSSWVQGGNRPERFAASHNMAEMWTSFAKTGKPGAKGQPEWPSYTLPNRPTMKIDHHCEVIMNRNGDEREMWRSKGYL
ncbi:MAG: carboxylesterase/lipase family protein [Saprospiraceae bacterium]|nr:carboxylesterase/lipase family protein [Saprospiraceae bacterium]